MEWVKIAYGSKVAASYPATGPGRPGYEIYLETLASGCADKSGIRVLDLGCGTGRYFHCLSNVSCLVGVDISPHMLNIANGVYRELTNLSKTDCILIETDLRTINFVPGSFDFIYSIGVLGEYSPFDKKILESIINWLAPSGQAFFTVVDKVNYQKDRRSKKLTLRGLVKKVIASSPLPKFLNDNLKAKFAFNYDYSHLYVAEHEIMKMLEVCSVPIQYDIIQFRDAKHPKLGCRIFKK